MRKSQNGNSIFVHLYIIICRIKSRVMVFVENHFRWVFFWRSKNSQLIWKLSEKLNSKQQIQTWRSTNYKKKLKYAWGNGTKIVDKSQNGKYFEVIFAIH